MATWSPGVRKHGPVVYLKGRGRVMPGKGCSQPIHTWDSCQICPGTSPRPLTVPAGTGGNRHVATGLKRSPLAEVACVKTNVHGILTMGWISSLPWEMLLGLQQCHRTTNSLKRSHHKVPGVSSVCLGVLQGAKEKLCISRLALIFQIQSSTPSVIITTASSPNEPLRYSGFCFPRLSLMWENIWIRTKYENVPVSSFLMETILVKCQTLYITLDKNAL